MGTEAISTITLCDTTQHVDEVLCTSALHFLTTRKQVPFSSLCVLPENAILIENDVAPLTNRRRARPVAIHAASYIVHNTPPDRYIFI
jgi:hypothetical protein